MLQPLQLEGVSVRYAEETAELREFLRMAGVRLDAPDSVGGVAQRLRQDRGFRRDLTSHVWVVLHGAGPGGLERRVGYPELLAMLALAAGGPRYAAMAEDADAHELLRFLMQARGAFAGSGEEASSSAMTMPRNVEGRSVERRWGATPLLSLPQGLPGSRRLGVWVVAVLLCVLLGGLVWMRRPQPAVQGNGVGVTTHGAAISEAPAARGVQSVQEAAVVAPAAVVRRGAMVSRTNANSGRPASDPGSQPASQPASALTVMRASQPASKAADKVAGRAPAGPGSKTVARLAQPEADASSLVPKVQPVEIAAAAEGGRAGTATRGGIVRPTSLGIMAGNVTYSPAPVYPAAASAARVQGEVRVEAEVDREGNVESTRVISGPPLLREAATEAVQQWRYRPYLVEGRPIAMSAVVVMEFQLP